MFLSVISEKNNPRFLTKFWNHPEQSEGDVKILLKTDGWFFPKITRKTCDY